MPAKKKNFYTYHEALAAAQALSIKRRSEYKKRFREDPRLPASPNQSYANAGWIDWYDFLGNERPNLYSTYTVAQAATQALGIKNHPDYNKRYHKDPSLPANPNKVYAGAGWIDWYDFLGNERPDLYPTYALAQAAAKSLVIESQSNYNKRYREDPRLPANPNKIYADAGWMDWYDFLGSKRPNLYSTYVESQAAAQALVIKSQPDYFKRYREDPGLPASPQRFYADTGWIDWYEFLGNQRPDLYPTYALAQAAAHALGINNQPDYYKRYREDPRLPASPNQTYADAGWIDWYDFLGNQRPVRIPCPLGHPFHEHPDSDSRLIRTLIPEPSGH